MARMKKSAAETKGAGAEGGAGVKVKAVEAYLAKVPEPARGTLEKMRAMIRVAAPKEATEEISYGIPTFKYRKAAGGLRSFGGNRGDEGRVEGLRHVERRYPIRVGRADADGAGEEDREGAIGGDRQ